MAMETASARADRDELRAVRRRFEVLAARWALDVCQAASLLGLAAEGCRRVTDLDPATVDAETRMRPAVEVDRLLDGVVPEDALAAWLREPNPAFVDDVTPLAAMSLGSHALRGVRRALDIDVAGRDAFHTRSGR